MIDRDLDHDLDLDLDLDQSLTDHGIIKSTKYHKYQNNIHSKNTTYRYAEGVINIESIINMAESIIKILKVL